MKCVHDILVHLVTQKNENKNNLKVKPPSMKRYSLLLVFFCGDASLRKRGDRGVKGASNFLIAFIIIVLLTTKTTHLHLNVRSVW